MTSDGRGSAGSRANPRGGFTLIELLVVVAIVAILAAIAVPNFLEAQTRSKVSAARANIRTGLTALETYAVDNNRYPPSLPAAGKDPLGVLADVQLERLTTPVSYLSSASSLRDPFGMIQMRVVVPSRKIQKQDNPFPELTPPNPRRSLLYYHYPDLAIRYQEPELYVRGASLVSIGPDLHDSLGAYRPFSAGLLARQFAGSGINHPLDTMYDPTNGTVSEGDIAGFAGMASRFSSP